jgi:hypothetical protein
MTIDEIAAFPTCYMRDDKKVCHESLLRSFQIVQKVRWLCEENTAPSVIAELITFMASQPDRHEIREQPMYAMPGPFKAHIEAHRIVPASDEAEGEHHES